MISVFTIYIVMRQKQILHKLATFSHVKQAQENKAYASAVTLEEIWKRFKMAESSCLCLYLPHAGSQL